MSWSSEEMESYVKLRKSLASKGHGRKSLSKTPSSPGSSAPSVNVDIDDKIASHIASLSKNVADRISAMSEGLMARFSEMLGQLQLNMSNRSFSAEPEVPGLTPLSGQSPPLCHPVCTDVHPISFRVPQRDRCLQIRASPTNQCLVMSLSTSNRWVFVAPLAGVERHGHGTLGGGGPALGLQDSLSCGPLTVQESHPFSLVQSLIHQGQGSGCRSALSC